MRRAVGTGHVQAPATSSARCLERFAARPRGSRGIQRPSRNPALPWVAGGAPREARGCRTSHGWHDARAGGVSHLQAAWLDRERSHAACELLSAPPAGASEACRWTGHPCKPLCLLTCSCGRCRLPPHPRRPEPPQTEIKQLGRYVQVGG